MSDKKGREWPIGIFIFYGVFVLSLLGFMIFSFSHSIDMVEEDYYEKGLNFENQIEGIRNTNALSHKPQFQVNRSVGQLILKMPSVFNYDGIKGTIQFFRPNDSSQDKGLNLKCSRDNVQIMAINALSPGKWKIRLNWTYQERFYYFEDIIIL